MFSLLLVHVTVLSEALYGKICATKVICLPLIISSLVLFNEIDSTFIVFGVTVTLHVAVTPLFVLALIFVSPTFLALIFPFVSTSAISMFSLLHEIVLSVVLSGFIVASNLKVCSSSRDISDLFNVIDSASIIGSFVVILHIAFLLFSVTTLTSALPAFLAVTFPSCDTSTIFVSDDFHVNPFLEFALSGFIVAINVSVFPT